MSLLATILSGYHIISMYPNSWVWPNHFLLCFLITWYFVDITTPRQKIYRLFNDTEDVVKLEVRFFRRTLLVVTSVLAIVHQVKPSMDSDYFFPILIGIIATFGWMYTNFRNEISNRANNTLNIISTQYGEEESAIRDQILLFANHADLKTVFPESIFDMKLSEISDKPLLDSRSSRTFTQIANRLLNELNRVALGVRQGRYDAAMIEKLLRPRYVRHAYLLSKFICKHTEAVKDKKSGQYYATKRTWEHFLWLVTRLPVYSSDKLPADVRVSHFVHPPIRPMSET